MNILDADRHAPDRGGLAELRTFDLYIGGAHVKPASGLYFSSDNPYSGEIWASVARGNAQDVDRAVAAAQAALPVWNSLKPSERGRLLVKLADLVERNLEQLAASEVRDNGKLLSEMLAQIRLVADWFRYYGGLEIGRAHV